MSPYEQLRQDLLAEQYSTPVREYKPKTRAVAPLATVLDLLAELGDSHELTVVQDAS